ncbi:MAG: hypothetical protein GY790_05100 [Bacteroidetes bacterium]|nr:hypothetical protein [Bacteroidota bacterium]
MVCSAFWFHDGASLDDWRKAAQELNEIGQMVKAALLPAYDSPVFHI